MGQFDGAPLPVDPGGAEAGQEVDPGGLVEGGGPEVQAVRVAVLEVGLGEWRPLVGEAGLIADEGDRPLVALLPEACGGLEAALSGAHDHHPAFRHWPLRRRSGPR
jgi:hypothetical protein